MTKQQSARNRIEQLYDRCKKLEQENERLHDVIRHLTRELDEAEEHAFAQQEKLSQLLEKERF